MVFQCEFGVRDLEWVGLGVSEFPHLVAVFSNLKDNES